MEKEYSDRPVEEPQEGGHGAEGNIPSHRTLQSPERRGGNYERDEDPNSHGETNWEAPGRTVCVCVARRTREKTNSEEQRPHNNAKNSQTARKRRYVELRYRAYQYRLTVHGSEDQETADGSAHRMRRAS